MAVPINQIDSELQLTEVLDIIMRAFKRRLMPVMAFATAFRNVALQGNDTVAVPYYPLDTITSKDFDQNAGYVFDEGSGTAMRNVVINKRKYKSLAVTSRDFNRQPQLRPDLLMGLKGEKLAEDVLTDIFSLITPANYGPSVCAVPSTAFDSNNVTDLRGVANTAMWPKLGRSIVLDTVYDTALFKDSDVKLSYAIGSDKTIRDGEIGQLLGFNYFDSPVLPDNGVNLAGFIAYMSAILVGFAPIQPEPSVAAKLSRYEIITDKETGLSLEYREWGDPDFDMGKRTIECNYGYNFGEKNALKLITTQ